MNGEELIKWAVQRCKDEGIPCYDCAIVGFIRELSGADLENLVTTRSRSRAKEIKSE